MTQRRLEQRRDKTWQHKTSSIFQMQLLNLGEGLKSRHADATVHVHPLSFLWKKKMKCKVQIRERGALRDLFLAPFFF